MSSTYTRMENDEMVLNMGPQHPSTHGVLRFILKTDGEIVHEAEPDVGYLHRSIEKIGEMLSFDQFMPYTDRVDYLAAMNANHAWARTVEVAAAIEIPRRAEIIRVIADELNRINSHLLAVGALGMDLGAATPFLHCIRQREKINDLLESLCGARLTFNFVTIGGVSFDLPDDFIARTTDFLDRFEPALDEFDRLLGQNVIFRERTAHIAPMSADDAVAHGLVGPNLRAAGVDWDLRRDEPYSIYPELDFEVPVGRGEAGTTGDCFDRYAVRLAEMRESVKLVRQCFERLGDADEGIQTKVPKKLKPPAGEVYVAVEAPRGEMGYYLTTDGGKSPYRIRIRTGSYTAMMAIRSLARGLMLADLVALIAAMDVVAPEIDR